MNAYLIFFFWVFVSASVGLFLLHRTGKELSLFSLLKHSPFFKWFLCSFVCLIAAGMFVIRSVSLEIDRESRSRLMNMGLTLSAAFSPGELTKLSCSASDLTMSEYITIRRQLSEMGSVMAHGGVRWMYFMNKQGKDIRFLVDSVPVGIYGHTEPGGNECVYAKAPRELLAAFSDGKARVVGPYRDEWGNFVSVFVPIKDAKGNVSVFGIDVDLSRWNREAMLRLMLVVQLLLFASVLLTVFMVVIEKAHFGGRRLSEIKEQMMLQDKMAALGQLAVGVAHEINTPLGFITNNVASLGKIAKKNKEFFDGVMSRVTDPESARLVAEIAEKTKMRTVFTKCDGIFHDIEDGIDRVKRIVQDMKLYARDNDENACFSINIVVESALNIVRNELKYVADISVDLTDVLHVCGSSQKLGQVFVNLLINAGHAVKSAHPDSKGSITVATYSEESSVIVVVCDNGCGMDEATKARIFEPFYTTKPVGVGTGLGLSISREIVLAHGGSIEVSSTKGEGTMFTITLPGAEQ